MLCGKGSPSDLGRCRAAARKSARQIRMEKPTQQNRNVDIQFCESKSYARECLFYAQIGENERLSGAPSPCEKRVGKRSAGSCQLICQKRLVSGRGSYKDNLPSQAKRSVSAGASFSDAELAGASFKNGFVIPCLVSRQLVLKVHLGPGPLFAPEVWTSTITVID